MRRNKERDGEFMESSRKRKKKKKVENERARKRKRGKFWNQVESKDKKKERMESYGYVCGGQNAREKKGGKCMDERNAKNKKSQFKNTTTIFSQ